MTSTLMRKCAGINEWTPIDEHQAAGEFTVKLFDWSKERRFVIVRERVRESKVAAGWLKGASSKLIPPKDCLAIGGGMI